MNTWYAGKSGALPEEQPLVVTTNPDSLLRCRRSLYEAVLQLEQQSVVVVERHLAHVDLALTPSTCMCVWTEQQLLQVRCVRVCVRACVCVCVCEACVHAMCGFRAASVMFVLYIL